MNYIQRTVYLIHDGIKPWKAIREIQTNVERGEQWLNGKETEGSRSTTLVWTKRERGESHPTQPHHVARSLVATPYPAYLMQLKIHENRVTRFRSLKTESERAPQRASAIKAWLAPGAGHCVGGELLLGWPAFLRSVPSNHRSPRRTRQCYLKINRGSASAPESTTQRVVKLCFYQVPTQSFRDSRRRHLRGGIVLSFCRSSLVACIWSAECCTLILE